MQCDENQKGADGDHGLDDRKTSFCNYVPCLARGEIKRTNEKNVRFSGRITEKSDVFMFLMKV